MNSAITPLAQLLTCSRPDDMPIAMEWRAQTCCGQSDWATFRNDVVALRGKLGDGGERRWLIVAEDAYAIGVALFAILHAGDTPILPGNLQSGHIATISETVYGVLYDGRDLDANGRAMPIFASRPNTPSTVFQPLCERSARVVLHTSGTTGDPLVIEKTLYSLSAEVSVLEDTFGTHFASTSTYHVCATVPAYHIYGLLFHVLWPLSAGRGICRSHVSYPEQLNSITAASDNIILISSPAFLKRVQDNIDLDGLAKNGGVIFSSGGPLPPDVAAFYNAVLSRPVIEVYGSTETGGIAYRSVLDAVNPPAWTPLQEVQLSTRAPDHLLSVKSPFTQDEDWFQTSDRVAIGDDGTFSLLGRVDQVVKLEELRVSLTEIERRLEACPEVSAAKVVPLVAKDDRRQSIGAVIVPSEMGWARLVAEGKRSLSKALSGSLAPYLSAVALPKRWRFVRRIPENDRGKPTQALLAGLFAEVQEQPSAPTILARETAPDHAMFRLRLDPEIKYFAGHFTNNPILAGVVQVDWAVSFALDMFPVSGRFSGIEALKFFKVLFAGQEVSLELRHDTGRNKIEFRYYDGETVFSSGRVIFKEAA